SKFTFRVESYSQELARNLDGTRRRVDSTEQLHYDFVQPGLHFTTPAVVGTTLVDQPTSVITVDFFAPTYIFSTAQGVLLFYHHNISTLRSETIAVQTTWRAKLYLPIIGGLGYGDREINLNGCFTFLPVYCFSHPPA
ncbi:MAG: hypothetical protein KDE31_30855, partial [Caldilineaceae bacterium]|nr:hypothetical protein [Caldilineaceae bacterium]